MSGKQSGIAARERPKDLEGIFVRALRKRRQQSI
jgi:hypothetical protein